MAEKKKKIRIGIDFDIQHQKLKSLKAQLQGIQQLTPKDIMATTGQTFGQAANNLREVRARAAQVEQALRKAFNPKLNTTNIEKFKQELGLSGKSLRSLREQFSKIGPQGELAFSRIESKVLQFGNTTRQTHNILSKMGTTLVNSIKWTIASSLVNNFTSSIQQAWGFTKSLDNSLNDIRIVTGKNADEMARFADKANAAAKSLGRTTTDYTKASLIYAQQGLSDAQNQARTRVTLKAANVTGQSAEEVSEELTAV